MDGTQSFPEIVKLLIENGLQSTLILFFLTLIFGLILGMIIAKGRMSKQWKNIVCDYLNPK